MSAPTGGRKRGAPATKSDANPAKRLKLAPEVQVVIDTIKKYRRAYQQSGMCVQGLKNSLNRALVESDEREKALLEEKKAHQATRKLFRELYAVFSGELSSIHAHRPEVREKVLNTLHQAFGKHIIEEQVKGAPLVEPLEDDSLWDRCQYGDLILLCGNFPNCSCLST
ncbi:hypothetical protein K491DRAFT_720933 [Lophiostoma macrostomum CBS 122681]|uniref:Uncharacterized protein n=1 Tax=Lophiostoma macrostomum CBS 122681 TaxID=1314788 RepID=A0A6A6SUY1_9PLEO|nr:hypothetical protein K491DRAFT_720933 [Lophiostoma macrostomum CBS 122681]